MEASSRQQQNIALLRAAIEAYNRGDLAFVIEQLDPEIEVYTAPGLVNSGTYRGIDGFTSWVAQWSEAWGSFRNEIRRVEPVGDHHVVAELMQHARGKGSGVEVEMSIAYMWEERDGKGIRFHLYPDWDQAKAAAERFRREHDRPG